MFVIFAIATTTNKTKQDKTKDKPYYYKQQTYYKELREIPAADCARSILIIMGTLFNMEPNMIATPNALVSNCEKHGMPNNGSCDRQASGEMSSSSFLVLLPHIQSANGTTNGISVIFMFIFCVFVASDNLQ
jgi:hypothetical protein